MPFKGIALEEHRTLVLNGDFRPLSIAPFSTYSWRESIEAVIAGDVEVLAEYDRVIRSPSIEMRLPSVIALREYRSLNRPAAFTRLNVFIRDGMRCQYCGLDCHSDQLTFDHVQPRSRGGASSFHNVVAACAPCNGGKADRTPSEAKMKLIGVPYHPTREVLNKLAMKLPIKRANIEKSWLDFLYWEVSLEA
jgi:5-methylcytosine-specific restriction endonuclease McrA